MNKTARLPNGMTIEDYENSMNTIRITLTGMWLELTDRDDNPVGFDLGLIAGYFPCMSGTTLMPVCGDPIWVKDRPADVKNKIEQARQQFDKHQAFVHEWSERFGFLATENPRDSIESIDEVAQILNRRYPVWANQMKSPTK